jgi:hypothetical protein
MIVHTTMVGFEIEFTAMTKTKTLVKLRYRDLGYINDEKEIMWKHKDMDKGTVMYRNKTKEMVKKEITDCYKFMTMNANVTVAREYGVITTPSEISDFKVRFLTLTEYYPKAFPKIKARTMSRSPDKEVYFDSAMTT